MMKNSFIAKIIISAMALAVLAGCSSPAQNNAQNAQSAPTTPQASTVAPATTPEASAVASATTPTDTGVKSYKWSDNAQYTFVYDTTRPTQNGNIWHGILTISGTGALQFRTSDKGFEGGSDFENDKQVIKLVINEGITSLSCDEEGIGTFFGYSDLETVELPNSLTTIDKETFESCVSLKTIHIPSSVTSIGENAFESGDELTIYGTVGSQAEAYAKENNIPFVAE